MTKPWEFKAAAIKFAAWLLLFGAIGVSMWLWSRSGFQEPREPRTVETKPSPADSTSSVIGEF